jgi:hypothetical protein
MKDRLEEGISTTFNVEVNACQNSLEQEEELLNRSSRKSSEILGDIDLQLEGGHDDAFHQAVNVIQDQEQVVGLQKVSKSVNMQDIETVADDSEVSTECESHRSEIVNEHQRNIPNETCDKGDIKSKIPTCWNNTDVSNTPVREILISLNGKSIADVQDKDENINTIKMWLQNNEKPKWSKVSPKSVELKYY